MATKSQEELDRRIAELGGSALVHSSVATKKRIPNPKYNAVAVAAGRSNEPEFIEVDVQQWRAPDGHLLQAYQTGDGWEVVQDEPAAKPSGQNDPTDRNAAELQRQRERNAALPPDQDPAYETDAERRKRGQDRIEQQGRDAKEAEAKTERERKEADQTPVDTSYVGTGKNRQKVTTYKSGRKVTEAAPQTATPTNVRYEADGTKVVSYDDGTETREQKDPATAASEARANRVTIDGRIYEVVPGKDGAASTLREIKNPNENPPPDLPALRAEAGQLSEEAKTLWEELNGRVRRGEITRAEAKAEFEGRYAVLQSRMAEIKSVIDTQRGVYSDALAQRGQDLSEVQSRRAAATQALNDANAYGRASSGKAGVNAPSLSAAMEEIIDRAARTQERFGGMREVAPVQMGRAAQQAMGLNLPGFTPPSGSGVAAPASEMAQPTDTAPFLSGSVDAPTPDRAAGMMANPAFRPQPPVGESQTMSQPPARDDWSTEGQPAATAGPSAAQKIINSRSGPLPPDGAGMFRGASNVRGTPMIDEPIPPALSSLLEFDIPGVGVMRINGQGQTRSAGSTMASQQPAATAPDDDSDSLRRMRDIAPNDAGWQRTLDDMERKNRRPSPMEMFA